jgi:4-oxalomesaconate tautomerase
MGLGDVTGTTVPKLSLLAPPRHGGAVTTRTFIPVRCHTSIGVLGTASVAAGLRIEGGVGAGLAVLPESGDRLRIEHPTGFLDIDSSVGAAGDGRPVARRTAVVRTARKIFDGTVFPRPAATAPTTTPAPPPAPASAQSPGDR